MKEGAGEGYQAFRIEAVDPRCKESIDLQWEMRRELDQMYGERTVEPPPLEQFMTPRAVFLVAWCGDEAVGCGAIKNMDRSTAHVKRVFVTPRMRGRGLGRQIMRSLEEKAREMGYSTMFLETADKQLEAIGMYDSLGYRRVPCEGRLGRSERSICYEKMI